MNGFRSRLKRFGGGLAATCTVALVLSGCSFSPSVSRPASRVEIAELDSGAWRAVFHFAEPVTLARFARPALFFREEAWRIVTPGYSFARDGDSQLLVLDRKARARDEIVVEFPVLTEPMPREYSPFLALSDGGLALYTGHFYVAPNAAVFDYVTTVVIDPGPDRALVLRDEVRDGAAVWTDPGMRGTYAYMGNTRPVRTPFLTAVIDPGLPEWLARAARRKIPEMMSFFAHRTGHSPARPPLVLVNYESGGDERDYNGGTLPGLLQFTLRGNGWQEESPSATETLFHFLAHESAHVWNGELGEHRPGSGPWMHEGAADAFADRALLESGLITPDRYRELKESALNSCNANLDDEPLNTTRRRQIIYPCGNVMALVTEAALRAAGSGLDLFGFWGRLIGRARAGDGYYDEESYFTLLRDLGASEATVAAIERFVREPQAWPAAAVAEMLAGSEIALVRDDASADAYALYEAAGRVLKQVLRQDCSGAYGYYEHDDYFELGRLGECAIARDGMEIARIGAVAVTAPAFQAAAYATERCLEEDTIRFGLYRSDEVVEFPCPSGLAPVRGFWRLSFENDPQLQETQRR